jgi:hypothetical protein
MNRIDIGIQYLCTCTFTITISMMLPKALISALAHIFWGRSWGLCCLCDTNLSHVHVCLKKMMQQLPDVPKAGPRHINPSIFCARSLGVSWLCHTNLANVHVCMKKMMQQLPDVPKAAPTPIHPTITVKCCLIL